MTALVTTESEISELELLKLAREIAMDIRPLDEILNTHNITKDQFERIAALPRFQLYLESEASAWHGSLNTHERVKLKAAAMLEEWLPELNMRMHDRSENLNAKIEAGKLARDLAGFAKNGVGVEGMGEKFSVTINLGQDSKLTFEKQLPPIVIDAEEAH
jgi:hypothetical protein